MFPVHVERAENLTCLFKWELLQYKILRFSRCFFSLHVIYLNFENCPEGYCDVSGVNSDDVN